ncbi:MAG: hypothetical protein GXN95_02145 [Methanococci archaeon]|nr:hypothetical protein [Methanococci archaeon]
MKGINPFYFYIGMALILALIVFILLITKSILLFILLAFGSLVGITLILIHISRKILKIDKGRLKKEVKGIFGNRVYKILGLMLVLGYAGFIYFFRTFYNGAVLFFIFIAAFTISEFYKTYKIITYEKGILIEGIAFYSWEEIEKTTNKDKNQTILKIKGIPKEIIINEII